MRLRDNTLHTPVRGERSPPAMLPGLSLLAALGMVGTTDAGDMRG